MFTTITLYREVNQKVRYYKLSLIPNLFGEYIFQREYGSIKANRPTRVIKDYFCSYKAAYTVLKDIVRKKEKRGYISKTKEKYS